MLYRTLLLTSGFIAVGLILGLAFVNKRMAIHQIRLLPMAAPFIFGAIPGILIYTETRFKIVSELLLVPLIVEIWTRANKYRKRELNA